MDVWNKIEQFYKKKSLRWLENVFKKKILPPHTLDRDTIRKVLVIRQHDMLGDFLLSTPALRALREHFPQAHIGLIVRDYFEEAARNNPYVDELLVTFKDGRNWTMGRALSFWRRLRQDWDLAVVLNTVSHSLTSDILAHLSKARYVLGSEHRVFEGCTRNFFYNLIAPYAPEEKHQTERNLDIVRHIGVNTNDLTEIAHLSDAERQASHDRLARLGLPAGSLTVGMHIGAGKAKNRWPVERFASLAQQIRNESNAQIVLFWGEEEEELAGRFCNSVQFAPIKFDPTGLRELAACFSRLDILVCNDTGVMHLCAAINVPVLAIFGPTDPALWKPWGARFVAVRGTDNTTEGVSIDRTFAALKTMLEADGRSLTLERGDIHLHDRNSSK